MKRDAIKIAHIASAKLRSQNGHVVIKTSAPVEIASLTLSVAISNDHSGYAALTPPPAPQHDASPLIFRISMNLIPGIFLITSLGAS